MAATIGPWLAGAARIATHRSRKRRDAGFAVGPRSHAPRAASSAGPSPVGWDTAPSTSIAPQSAAPMNGCAGSARRLRCRTLRSRSSRRERSGLRQSAPACGSPPSPSRCRSKKRLAAAKCGSSRTRSELRSLPARRTYVLFGRGHGALCPAIESCPPGASRSGPASRARASRCDWPSAPVLVSA
jgi:hypothetical protein